MGFSQRIRVALSVLSSSLRCGHLENDVVNAGNWVLIVCVSTTLVVVQVRNDVSNSVSAELGSKQRFAIPSQPSRFGELKSTSTRSSIQIGRQLEIAGHFHAPGVIGYKHFTRVSVGSLKPCKTKYCPFCYTLLLSHPREDCPP
jgi:hypothetical protein